MFSPPMQTNMLSKAYIEDRRYLAKKKEVVEFNIG